MSKSKRGEEGKSEAIRKQIELIPAAKLSNAKPKMILDALEAEGWEIDPSLRSTTSRLLKIAKQSTVAPHQDMGKVSQTSLELAVDLVKACGGFEAARSVITKLEHLVQDMPR